MKTVIVTGGSRGIGAAIVKELAKNNYNVVLNYNNSEEAAKQIQKELQEENIHIEIFKADVSKREDCKKIVEYTIQKYKKIDVLVNNAGICNDTLFEDKTKENFMEILETNLVGTFLVSI